MDDREDYVPPSPPVAKLDDVYKWEAEAGIHDRSQLALRVKWVGALREIVGKTVPTNKVGAPLISDVDLLCATAEQRLEAYRKVVARPQ